MADRKYTVEIDFDTDGADKAIAETTAVDKSVQKLDATTKKSTKTSQDHDNMLKRLRANWKAFDNRLDTSTDFVRDWGVAMRGINMSTAIVGTVSLSGAVFALVGDLVALTGTLYTLPGLIGAFIGAGLTAKAIFSGLGDAFGELAAQQEAAGAASAKVQRTLAGFDRINVLNNPDAFGGGAGAALTAFNKLGPITQDFVRRMYELGQVFREQVVKPAQEIAFEGVADSWSRAFYTQLPVIQAAINQVAGAFNGMFLEFGRVANTPLFSALITETGRLATALIAGLTPAIEPSVGLLVGLFRIGEPYIQRMTAALVAQITAWNEYVNSAEGASRINQTIENGIAVFGALGRIVESVFSALTAVMDVSVAKGLVVENAIADVIDRFTAWVKTAEGSETIGNLIQFAADAIYALGDAIAIVSVPFRWLIDQFALLDQETRQFVISVGLVALSIVPILSYFGALAQSITSITGLFGVGLNTLLPNVGKGFTALLGPVGLVIAAFTLLFTASEDFRNAIGDLLGKTLGAVMDIFKGLFAAIQPVIDVVMSLAGAIGNILAPIISGIGLTVQIVGTILGAVFQSIGIALQIVLAPFQILFNIIGQIASQINAIFAPAFEAVGAIWDKIGGIFDIVFGAISSVIGSVIESVVNFVMESEFMQAALAGIQIVVDGLIKGLEWVADVLDQVAAALTGQSEEARKAAEETKKKAEADKLAAEETKKAAEAQETLNSKIRDYLGVAGSITNTKQTLEETKVAYQDFAASSGLSIDAIILKMKQNQDGVRSLTDQELKLFDLYSDYQTAADSYTTANDKIIEGLNNTEVQSGLLSDRWGTLPGVADQAMTQAGNTFTTKSTQTGIQAGQNLVQNMNAQVNNGQTLKVGTTAVDQIASGLASNAGIISRSLGPAAAQQFQQVMNTIRALDWNSIFGALQPAFRAAWNSLLTLVNGKAFSVRVNSIKWGPIELPGITASAGINFPRLARGGIVDKSTFAEIGEDGTEAVVPLENNTEWMDKIANNLAKKMGINAGPRNIILQVDGRELGRAAVDNINSMSAVGGVNLSIV